MKEDQFCVWNLYLFYLDFKDDGVFPFRPQTYPLKDVMCAGDVHNI